MYQMQFCLTGSKNTESFTTQHNECVCVRVCVTVCSCVRVSVRVRVLLLPDGEGSWVFANVLVQV